MATEESKFEVVSKAENYEIRYYEERLVIQNMVFRKTILFYKK